MLELSGYEVVTAHNVQAAREYLERDSADLLVLDIMLPDGSGLGFCEEVRRKTGVPILFLTALGTKTSIVKGLRAGGDDYLSKPYDYDELLARIEALLRRADRQAVLLEDIGQLHMDYTAGRAFVYGIDALLKPKEFALLRLLVERAGEYIAPAELYRSVWGEDAAGDARTVYVHIAGLRKKLRGTVAIEQARGRGYRLGEAKDGGGFSLQ